MRLSVSIVCVLLCAVNGYCQRYDKMWERAKNRTTEELVDDLRSDNLRFNAEYACFELWQQNDPKTLSLVEAALDSDDWQQRQLAAHVVMLLTLRDPFYSTDVFRLETDLKRAQNSDTVYQPSEKLAEVIVEGFKDDHLPVLEPEEDPDGTGACLFIFNLARGVEYLLQYPHTGTRVLETGLDSSDPQQQFYCAFVLAVTHRHERFDPILKILIENTKDDQVIGNACRAMFAIYQMGDKTLPTLNTYTEAEDAQQRKAVRLVLAAFKHPPKTSNDIGMVDFPFASKNPTLQLSLSYVGWVW